VSAPVAAPNTVVTVDTGPGSANAASAGGIAGTGTLGLAEGALARRWPADWFSRYDTPVARILPRSNSATVHRALVAPRSGRAIVAAGTDAEVYPVRWPRLVGRPLPPVTSATSVMGAPASPPSRP
jgi:hypothetical protein